MTLVVHPGATPAVQQCVFNIIAHINTPAIRYEPQGQGTKRRLIREAAKKKANMLADKARTKRLMQKATVADVELIDTITEGVQEVRVLGQRVGTIKQLGDKAVLFNNAADEVSSRARVRDLKKAAAGLFVGSAKPLPGKGRDVAQLMRERGLS